MMSRISKNVRRLSGLALGWGVVACSEPASSTDLADTEPDGIATLGKDDGEGVRRRDPSSTTATSTSETSPAGSTGGVEDGEDTDDDDDASGGSPGTHSALRFDVGEYEDTISIGPTEEECDGLIATVRDMKDDHPDFEVYSGNRPYVGLVEVMLGDDNTPTLATDYDGPAMITSAESFYDWYHDVDGTNEAFTIELTLEEDGDGIYLFESDAFFPLDDMGFGNEGRSHNYHFTTEVHTSFTYTGGEVFTFRGDDDLWMFVNGQLVIDLGGLHSALSASVEMDTLELTIGETYPMDIFHAERHTSQSNFRIETTIDCFVAPLPEG